MLFHSFEFIVLLTITFAIFYFFPKRRSQLLAIANLVFYGVSGLRYLVVFLLVSFITFYCSKQLNKRFGKIYLYIGLLINILNLTFFKYTGFILENVEKVLGLQLPWQDTLLAQIILPVGISFYTFQLIAYLVDVWRKDIEPCENFIVFWVFISFFAQLIAGPIMRGKEFIPQVYGVSQTKFDASKFRLGLYYIFRGFIKKIIFADTIAPMVNQYFSSVSTMSGIDAWYATYLFAFQIFFDFSAYSEFALGIGHLFGFDMAINFKTPYVSSNPKEFWKRWHITLSSWIRDYIYIPMGGGQKSFQLKCFYVLIAMMISGLWHGAKWTFIIWGIYHGLLSVAHNIYINYFSDIRAKLKNNMLYKIVTTFVFFQLTNIGWVLFRANTLGDAIILLKKMLLFNPLNISRSHISFFAVIILLYLIHLLEYAININEKSIAKKWMTKVPTFVRTAAYAALIIILIIFTVSEESTFIYFQF